MGGRLLFHRHTKETLMVRRNTLIKSNVVGGICLWLGSGDYKKGPTKFCDLWCYRITSWIMCVHDSFNNTISTTRNYIFKETSILSSLVNRFIKFLEKNDFFKIETVRKKGELSFRIWKTVSTEGLFIRGLTTTRFSTRTLLWETHVQVYCFFYL